MLIRKPEPLLDERPFVRRRTEHLLSLGRFRSRAGEVQGDDVALDEQEVLGALEGRDLAQRELGQVLSGFVVLPKLEVIGRGDVVAANGSNCEALNDEVSPG